MPTFTYQARDVSGKRVSGKMEGISKGEIVEKLRNLGYLPTQVAGSLPSLEVNRLLESVQWLGPEDLAIFNVQLSNLISAGVPLLASLRTLAPQIENRVLRSTVESVACAVESGESFSEALSHHPRVFPELLATLVRVGEAAGKLDEILSRYAAYCERQTELRCKIQGATLYPIILVTASVGVVLFVVSTLIPQFVQIFLKAGVPLPLPTLILYKFGTGLRHFWLSSILFLALGWAALWYYGGREGGRFQMDRLKLSLPVIGPLLRRSAIVRFARTFALLVTSGVPLLQSLEIVRNVVGNEVLARVVDRARAAVEKGEKISDLLKTSGEFPQDMVQIVSVGEETGRLDTLLNKAADFYERGVDHSIKQLATLLEPLLLIAIGGLVGLILASLLLPMFDMMKIIRS